MAPDSRPELQASAGDGGDGVGADGLVFGPALLTFTADALSIEVDVTLKWFDDVFALAAAKRSVAEGVVFSVCFTSIEALGIAA